VKKSKFNLKNMKKKSDFLLWHNEKYKINIRNVDDIYFKEKEVWFCRVGLNVGYEEDGKGKNFLRPVLVVKKIGKNIFIGVPLTTSDKHKDNKYYYEFEYIEDVKSYAILSQLKCFDSKRLDYKSGEIKLEDFLKIKEKLKEFFL